MTSPRVLPFSNSNRHASCGSNFLQANAKKNFVFCRPWFLQRPVDCDWRISRQKKQWQIRENMHQLELVWAELPRCHQLDLEWRLCEASPGIKSDWNQTSNNLLWNSGPSQRNKTWELNRGKHALDRLKLMPSKLLWALHAHQGKFHTFHHACSGWASPWALSPTLSPYE